MSAIGSNVSDVVEPVNNLAGLAALVNSLILWPVVRSLQKAVNEMKEAHQNRGRRPRRKKSNGRQPVSN